MKIKNGQGDYILEEDGHITIMKDDTLHHYDVLESKGFLHHPGYAVLNYICVDEGNEDEFEDRFLNRKSNLASSEGFSALRVLKPQDDEHYVILSLWEDYDSFKNWQASSEYQSTHQKRGTSTGMDREIINRDRSYNIRFEII